MRLDKLSYGFFLTWNICSILSLIIVPKDKALKAHRSMISVLSLEFSPFEDSSKRGGSGRTALRNVGWNCTNAAQRNCGTFQVNEVNREAHTHLYFTTKGYS